MAMVIPRSFSSGALSISSNGVKSARPSLDSTLVMAAVSVVLPWSMWPIVPMLMWGLFRSNFCFAIALPLLPLFASYSGDDLPRQSLRHFLVRVQLHRRVRCPPLRARPELSRVAEQLGQRDEHPDGLLARAVV